MLSDSAAWQGIHLFLARGPAQHCPLSLVQLVVMPIFWGRFLSRGALEWLLIPLLLHQYMLSAGFFVPGSLSWLLLPSYWLSPCSSSSPVPCPGNGLSAVSSSSFTAPSLEPFCKQCCKWWGSYSKTVVKAVFRVSGFIQHCQWQTKEQERKTCCKDCICQEN